jgi:hypothetical protein
MTEVLTALLVVVTAAYTIATYRILKANRATVAILRDQVVALNRPYVTIGVVLEPKVMLFHLSVRNIGKTPAENVTLSIDRPFHQMADPRPEADIRRRTAFNDPISSFAPGAEIAFPLAQAFTLWGEAAKPDLTPSRFQVTARYSFGGTPVIETSVIDFSPYFESEPPIDLHLDGREALVKATEKVANAIERLSK